MANSGGRAGEELRRAFPNVYGSTSRQPVPVTHGVRPQIAESIARIGRTLQRPAVQAVLEPGCPGSGGIGQLRMIRPPRPVVVPSLQATRPSGSGGPVIQPTVRSRQPTTLSGGTISQPSTLVRPRAPGYGGTVREATTLRPGSGSGGSRQLQLQLPTTRPFGSGGIGQLNLPTTRPGSGSGGNGQLRFLQPPRTSGSSEYGRDDVHESQPQPCRFAPRLHRYSRLQSYAPYKRPSRRSRSCSGSASGLFSRNVVIVSSDEDALPRGPRRQELNELGAIVHLVDFNKEWTEEEMREAIESAFAGLIDPSKPSPRFYFLKAVSGKLMQPHVGPCHQWTGEKVKQLTGQGDIYIRPSYPLHLEKPEDCKDSTCNKETSSESGDEGKFVGDDFGEGPGRDDFGEWPGRDDFGEGPGRDDFGEGPGRDDIGHPEATALHGASNYEEDLCQLQDLFGEIYPQSVLNEALKRANGNISSAVEDLLGESDVVGPSGLNSSSLPPVAAPICQGGNGNVRVIQLKSEAGSSSQHTPGTECNPIQVEPGEDVQTLEALLHRHAEKTMDQSAEYTLSVNRTSKDNFWLSVTAFYKAARVRPQKLRKELVVQFSETGEIGADAGALRKEFFEDAIQEANLRLFEGRENHRIPKKAFSMEAMLELAGMLVAHSVLQGGPALPCLSESVFDHFVTGKVSSCYPSIEDIPLDLATHDLITFIEKLDDTQTDDEIDKLMDAPASLFILNRSAWSAVEPVTTVNKSSLLQHLILEEVIIRREENLRAFVRGLDCLKLGSLVQSYPHLTKQMFVAQFNPLTPDIFWSLVESLRPQEEKQQRAHDFFKSFVAYLGDMEEVLCENVSLSTLLRFITGASAVPPMGISHPIEFQYQPDVSTNVFLKAQACFSKLFIPIVHATKEEFFSACIKSLQFGGGYGVV